MEDAAMPAHFGEVTETILYILAFLLSFDLFVLFRLYMPLVPNAASVLRLEEGSGVFVSVVVCAGRDLGRLQRTLSALLSQDYRHYEVVVVDDSRDEECGYLLERLRQQHSQLRVTVAASDYKFLSGANLAFTLGVKAARGEWVLFTESGAVPVGMGWVGGMAMRMVSSVDVLLGYGAYGAGGSWVGTSILRWRRLMRLGYAQWGCFYLADMCNMAIRRELFLSQHQRLGFSDLRGGMPLRLSPDVLSGGRVGVFLSPVAHVQEEGAASWSEFLYRRRIRRQAQRGYPQRVRLALAAEPSLRVLVWCVALVAFLYDPRSVWYAFGAVLLRQLVVMTLSLLLRLRLHDQALFVGTLLADLLVPFLALYPSGGRYNVKNTARWR